MKTLFNCLTSCKHQHFSSESKDKTCCSKEARLNAISECIDFLKEARREIYSGRNR
jgi:hypothetical protein